MISVAGSSAAKASKKPSGTKKGPKRSSRAGTSNRAPSEAVSQGQSAHPEFISEQGEGDLVDPEAL